MTDALHPRHASEAASTEAQQQTDPGLLGSDLAQTSADLRALRDDLEATPRISVAQLEKLTTLADAIDGVGALLVANDNVLVSRDILDPVTDPLDPTLRGPGYLGSEPARSVALGHEAVVEPDPPHVGLERKDIAG